MNQLNNEQWKALGDEPSVFLNLAETFETQSCGNFYGIADVSVDKKLIYIYYSTFSLKC